MKKIGFVVPWYGEKIPGGTESATRNLVYRLAKRGEAVEVLTTCVREFHSDWNVNYHPHGVQESRGITVRRFKVRKRDTLKFDAVNAKLMANQSVSLEEERIYLEEMINSPALMDYIQDHKDEYKVFIFTPYMFGTTYYGVQRVFDQAILFPAFHDEIYAYFKSFREAYSKVKGIIFNSDAEKEWAEQHYDLSEVKTRVIGLGVENFSSDIARFRKKYGMNDPFILYAGRKDHGKNVYQLIDFFANYVKNNGIRNLKLVLIGGGQIDIPPHCSDQIVDLGFVDEQDKYDAYSAASLLCNPSLFESFSIVLMESWLAGTPVLVHEKCAVTKRFAEISNGGLYFSTYDEFACCLDVLFHHEGLRNKLGHNGQKFVRDHFTWERVMDNYVSFIKECNNEGGNYAYK